MSISLNFTHFCENFLNHMFKNISVKSLLILFTCVYGFLIISSCSKDEKGIDDLEAYFKEKNLKPQVTDDGLYYIIDNPGNEVKPNLNSNVSCKYKGYLQTGKVFDDNMGKVADFNLSGTVPGFRRGFLLLGEGGKATIFIPAYLGYGDQDRGTIPPGSSLIFEIELIDVK